jgi:predicted TPR repeat methyltransferase
MANCDRKDYRTCRRAGAIDNAAAMAADALQIALEHHRAGRLSQAAAIYRTLIDGDPKHAQALHWLGVLAFQAGRAEQAVPLLERALALQGDDAAFAHNLGMACLQCGRFAEAIGAFERAIKSAPDRGETLMAWGLAHLSRGAAGDAQAAAFAFGQARLAGLDTAVVHQHLGVAQMAAGNLQEAIAAFQMATQKDPHDATAWHHLALAYRHLGDVKQVRKCLNKALEIDPERASAWCALGALDAEEGNYDIAAGLFKKAIKANPDYPTAHHALGRVLELAGRRAESIAAFGQALRASRRAFVSPRAAAKNPDPAALLASLEDMEAKLTSPRSIEIHHALAANADIFSPVHVPANALAKLFDRYAETFDVHLQGQLQYRAPQFLAEAIGAALGDEKKLDILDLGCGTGLCGPLLKPIAKSLAGVDLSPNMIEKCKARGVYDRLGVGELVATLNDNPAAFDLLIAADVLIYLGDLSPAFEAAAKSLRPGGLLAFTVEAGGGERYHLQRKTLRYTHAEPYLKHVAAIHGFEEVSFETAVLRVENEKPVLGFVIVVRRGALG